MARRFLLPALAVGDRLEAERLEAKSHATQPPARYTEASLVKTLEEMGVGRPSTYATIIENIQSRGYVWKRGSALVPSWVAFAVVGLLEQYFAQLVDYGFTASMEEELDEIANGQEESVPYLHRFYFGNGATGLRTLVSEQLADIDAREINSIPIGDGVVVRVGRYGPYVQKGDERASIPEDLPPDELTVDKADELLHAGSTDRVVGTDPATGLPVLIRAGRFGPYVQLGDSEDGAGRGAGAGAGAVAKPRTASLFSHHDPQKVSLDEALQLLTLPRVVGVDPSDGQEIVAQNGRYGPYLRKAKDSRSLATEAQLFDVTLDEALSLFAQPKVRRGQQPAAPLRTLGDDPETGQPIVLRDGRFGPYVTDGTTNASLRKGDTVDALTHERAVELLAERRAAGPSARKARGTKKAAATPAKKATATRAKKATATRAKKATPAKTASKKVAQKRA